MIVHIAFWKHKKKWIHKAISFFTGFAKYTHAEIIVGEEWISSEFDVGVRKTTDISGNPKKWDIYEINITESEKFLIDVEVQSLLGSRYDWSGIFLSQLVPFRLHDRSKWFCSELVAHLLTYSGAYVLPPANLLSPKDLYRLLQDHLRKIDWPYTPD